MLKICYLAEFTLAVEPVLAIMIFIAKWLIERAGNLTGLRASFCSVRKISMIKCNSKLNKLLFSLTLDCFRPVGLYSDGVHVIWATFLTLTDKPTLSFGSRMIILDDQARQ